MTGCIPFALYGQGHAVFKHNSCKPETGSEATHFIR